MITDLVIEDFQSVKAAHFKLGGLTVITGPTGSGKSGSLRAFELAAFNRLGTSYIRKGAKSCKVGFGSQEEGWFLAIERGARGKDSYRISRVPAGDEDADVQTFTKLGGQAPPEVLQLHRLGRLNFVGQLEAPFLLGASGTEVARVLGELTNVTLVYEAARAGARRRLRLAGDLRHAEAEAATLVEQVQQYAQLPVQLAAQERAEQALVRAREAEASLSRLRGLGFQALGAMAEVQRAEDKVAAVEPPSLESVETLLAQCQRLAVLIVQVRSAREEAARQHHFGEVARAREQEAHQAVHAALEEMGTCPTCGQEIPVA